MRHEIYEEAFMEIYGCSVAEIALLLTDSQSFFDKHSNAIQFHRYINNQHLLVEKEEDGNAVRRI